MTTEADIRHGLYVAHRSALIDYAARILGSREAAEDIVQDAYLRFAPGRMGGVREDLALRGGRPPFRTLAKRREADHAKTVDHQVRLATERDIDFFAPFDILPGA